MEVGKQSVEISSSTCSGVVTPALTSLTRASAEMRVLATRKISGVAMTQELAGWSNQVFPRLIQFHTIHKIGTLDGF